MPVLEMPLHTVFVINVDATLNAFLIVASAFPKPSAHANMECLPSWKRCQVPSLPSARSLRCRMTGCWLASMGWRLYQGGASRLFAV